MASWWTVCTRGWTDERNQGLTQQKCVWRCHQCVGNTIEEETVSQWTSSPEISSPLLSVFFLAEFHITSAFYQSRWRLEIISRNKCLERRRCWNKWQVRALNWHIDRFKTSFDGPNYQTGSPTLVMGENDSLVILSFSGILHRGCIRESLTESDELMSGLQKIKFIYGWSSCLVPQMQKWWNEK